MTPRLLRALAVIIAIAGAIDPSLASTRRIKPPIAVVSTSAPADMQLADRLSRELASVFGVVRGPLAGAAAVISAGDHLPADIDTFPSSTPAFAVTHVPDAPTVR